MNSRNSETTLTRYPQHTVVSWQRQPTTRVLIVGNPGAGKSFLLRCMTGDTGFKHGFSLAEGLTKVNRSCIVNGIEYIDTPGILEPARSSFNFEQLAMEIQRGRPTKIVFVVSVTSSGSMTTDNVILINEFVGRMNITRYGIIFNKVPFVPSLYKKLQLEAHNDYNLLSLRKQQCIQHLKFEPALYIMIKVLSASRENILNYEDLQESDFTYRESVEELIRLLPPTTVGAPRKAENPTGIVPRRAQQTIPAACNYGSNPTNPFVMETGGLSVSHQHIESASMLKRSSDPSYVN